jgi:hypothetical protein
MPKRIHNKKLYFTKDQPWQLFKLRMNDSFFQAKEFLNNVRKYWKNPTFAKADLTLFFMYLFDNPFFISKRFLKEHGASDIYTYGETPIATFEKISTLAEIKPQDHLIELGCGRGKTCFWARIFLKCRVTGIDFVPAFIERAKRIQKKLNIDNLQFITGDMLEEDFSSGTIFYLYGITLTDIFLTELTKRFEKMPAGTRFITVSFPLSDYSQDKQFEITRCFISEFPWGKTEVFLQVRK